MKIGSTFKKLLALKRKQKIVLTPQDVRMQKQLDYIERSQTPGIRVDAIQKRINERKARR